jgi:hypothetical protein
MRRRTSLTAIVLLGVFGGLGVSGCSRMGVQPWERDVLAEPGMQVDPSPVVTALDEHIYFSKEASTGGLGTAGGGCGCN